MIGSVLFTVNVLTHLHIRVQGHIAGGTVIVSAWGAEVGKVSFGSLWGTHCGRREGGEVGDRPDGGRDAT